MEFKNTSIEDLSVNTIRTLSIDAIQAANSGHPGAPMGLASVGYELWQNHLNYNPDNPDWLNRDRFILSIGHASMLLYSLLFLTEVKNSNKNFDQEYAITLDDIKNFRQLYSPCHGHPEYKNISGIETTTGPLGQGLAVSVGMAMGEKWLKQHFNRDGYEIFDYNMYALCGDGCLMEGISYEAASFAGHLKLSNLCWIYDSNKITIEGSTDIAFTEDITTRFISMGWDVIHVADGNNLKMLSKAFDEFKKNEKPTLIIADTKIAFGSPNKQGKASSHGAPLGEEEVKLTKKNYNWPEDKKFLVPDKVKPHFADGIGKRGKDLYNNWLKKFNEYKKAYPELASELEMMNSNKLPDGWDKDLPFFEPDEKGMATRVSAGKVLNSIAKNVSWIMGGSADLGPSTNTVLKFDDAGVFNSEHSGRNIHFGVREHSMGAIVNGLCHSKIKAYGATFLVFFDYMKAPMRLSAMMRLSSTFIFTHDSISVGEDGPTHQPLEQIASIRLIPGFILLRPCDANEVVEAWKFIMHNTQKPVALILSRQAIPTIDRKKYANANGLHKGAYVLYDKSKGKKPDIILIATGSEVNMCLKACDILFKDGIKARVVSMPSWEIFDAQTKKYQEQVLPQDVKKRIAIEQASALGWEKYVGDEGEIIGLRDFGLSAPFSVLQKHYGFTVESIVEKAKKIL